VPDRDALAQNHAERGRAFERGAEFGAPAALVAAPCYYW